LKAVLRAEALDLLLFFHRRHLVPHPLDKMIQRSASREGHFSIAAVSTSEMDVRHPDESCVSGPLSRAAASRSARPAGDGGSRSALGLFERLRATFVLYSPIFSHVTRGPGSGLGT
jgi:hypothetical protein